jgi:GNAT superfamily N-acetyltransferase
VSALLACFFDTTFTGISPAGFLPALKFCYFAALVYGMSDIVIREATPADLDALLQCEQGIVGYERPFDGTLKDGEIHYYDLAEMIVADDVQVVVAEVEGNVVGSGYARIEKPKPYHKHTDYAYLGCMYVDPEFRGKGINSLVLDALKAWCRSRNITELRLEVYTYNQPAIKAYEKAGFTPILTWMRMGLDEE